MLTLNANKFLKTSVELHLKPSLRNVVNFNNYNRISKVHLVKLCKLEMKRMNWNAEVKKSKIKAKELNENCKN